MFGQHSAGHDWQRRFIGFLRFGGHDWQRRDDIRRIDIRRIDIRRIDVRRIDVRRIDVRRIGRIRCCGRVELRWRSRIRR